MLQFNIQDIPEGKSSRNVILPEHFFEFENEDAFLGAEVSVEFYRTDHFIKLSFIVDADLQLTCDRSLDTFEFNASGSFDMLFEPGDVEEYETKDSAVRQIDGGTLQLDIQKEVYDTILLQIPGRKVHPRFLDEHGNITEFETRVFGKPENEDEEPVDPRWEDLKKLK